MTENGAKLIANDVNEALNVADEVIKELEKRIGKCHSEMKELENKQDIYSHHIFDEYHYQAIAYDEAIRIIKERLVGK